MQGGSFDRLAEVIQYRSSFPAVEESTPLWHTACRQKRHRDEAYTHLCPRQSKEAIVNQKDRQQKPSWLSRLGEDWLAVIIGLGLVVLVWIGAIAKVPWPLFGFLQ